MLLWRVLAVSCLPHSVLGRRAGFWFHRAAQKALAGCAGMAVNHKFSFHLLSKDRRRPLPPKIIIGRGDTETELQVVLRLLGYLLFFRERLQIHPSLHDDDIPFAPDLVELDYSLRPVLWIECGECTAQKLDKLAVKVPESEIWVLLSSVPEAVTLLAAMHRHRLRRHRYNILTLDTDLVSEVRGQLRPRNELLLVRADFDPPELRFDFNGLWFEAPFEIRQF
jgi:uncharacterized protein YaeQ